MEGFVVERYIPGTSDKEMLAASGRLAAATRKLAGNGVPLRYLGSTFVAEEEYCFCRFEGGSAEDVRRACELAKVAYARIVRAREIDAPATPQRPSNHGRQP